MFFLDRRLDFGKQAGRNEGIARGIGFHVVEDSRPPL
jgi:tetrahydromethanopterin S-methyltransferase subunit F